MARLKFSYPAYRQPSHVTFGVGSIRELAPHLAPARTVVLTSGTPRVRQMLEAAVQAQGTTLDAARILSKPAGEPEPAMIAAAADWLAARPVETVVAVGGGSVLDWARLTLATANRWLDPGEGHLRQGVQPRDRPALILVPTTCGSGAEASAVAVYMKDGEKVPVVSDAFLADRVILDGQFLSDVPPARMASWVSDAISHSVEAFVSLVPNPFAKEAAVGALHAILDATPHGSVRERNQHLMEAGFLAGAAASNCSVGVIHAFAHTMARYGVPHGVGNALGLAAGIRANAATAEMRGLLDRLGLATAEDLIAQIEPLTLPAVTPEIAAGIRTLTSGPEREGILQRMASDVCLRSNPRRMTGDDLVEFIDTLVGALNPA